jgi:hypothetical protein
VLRDITLFSLDSFNDKNFVMHLSHSDSFLT